MQLPSVERIASLRPAADAVSSGANRVVPVAPANPPSEAAAPADTGPGVINHVNPSLQAGASAAHTDGPAVYTSVPDPMKNSSATQVLPHDWTIHKPAPEKVETPAPKPISQVLIDNLKTVWTASASAVQVEQVRHQLASPPPPSSSLPVGQVAQQAMVYQPSKIKKTGGV